VVKTITKHVACVQTNLCYQIDTGLFMNDFSTDMIA